MRSIKSLIRAFVRNFAENGFKLLLQRSANAHDLLALTGSPLVEQIVWEKLTVSSTSFVARDFRHREVDLVLTAPLRPMRGQRARRVTMYILIEHQSKPDRWMLLRVLDYVVQILRRQCRDLGRRGRDVLLQPVLPIVFYTGDQSWPSLGNLVELIERGEEFRDVTPILQPLFVSLPALTGEHLRTAGGIFGSVLELFQHRRDRAEKFRDLLELVITRLEKLPEHERERWLELLSYIQALVYHERGEPEHTELEATIEASVQTDRRRKEVAMVKRSYADAMIDKGRKEGAVRALREMLIFQLQDRFGTLTSEQKEVIEATQDVAQLRAWAKRFYRAATVGEVLREEP